MQAFQLDRLIAILVKEDNPNMKRNRLTVLIALCMMLSLMAGSTTAAAMTAPEEPLTEITLPLVTEPTTLTIYMELDVMDFSAYDNSANMPVSQEIMRRTGLTLKFIHPPAGMGREHFNMTIASGEIPDIVFGCFGSYYTGGAEQAYRDGLILDPAPLVEKYAPNFKKLVLSQDLARKIVHTDNGFLSGFGATIAFDVAYGDGFVYGGPMIRRDLLEKSGLPIPVTIDDWSVMLAKFKEMGVKYPLGWAHDGKNWDPMWSDWTFLSAYELGRDWIVKDGKIVFSRTEADFKNYIALLADWYAKGYIDPDFTTKTYLEHLKYASQIGEVGACDHHIYEYGSIHPASVEGGFDMIPVPEPVLTAGQKLRVKQDWGWDCGNEGKYISAKCKNPEVAAKFIDWLYTEEAKRIYCWGIEGVSYEIVDGKPQYTEFYHSNEEINNRLYSPNSWNQNVSQDQNMAQYSLPIQQEAFKVWGNNDLYDIKDGRSLRLPIGFGVASFSPDESTTFNEAFVPINDYFQAMFIKMVMGVEPVDKFDEMVQTMKDMGIQKCVDIYQAAYDRFLAR
jgi:putative aldouronate transport system substrate-binding protein